MLTLHELRVLSLGCKTPLILKKESTPQKPKSPLSLQENEQKNVEQLSRQPSISVDDAKAQAQRLKAQSRSIVKRGHASMQR